MFAVSAEVTFSAAHSLSGYAGPCEKVHGHNYRIRLTVASPRLEALGWVMDFADLKRLLQEITAPFDHRNLNEVPPFDRLNPTAEHLARHFFHEAARRVNSPARVCRAEVFETPTSCAVFEDTEHGL
jgi:6-pyruvoyltetrahydropterin/6-carboxytetrahydropterin synthase